MKTVTVVGSGASALHFAQSALELGWRVRPSMRFEVDTVAYHHYLDRSWTKINAFDGLDLRCDRLDDGVPTGSCPEPTPTPTDHPTGTPTPTPSPTPTSTPSPTPTSSPTPTGTAICGNGVVDERDVEFFKRSFFGEPGPSGTAAP